MVWLVAMELLDSTLPPCGSEGCHSGRVSHAAVARPRKPGIIHVRFRLNILGISQKPAAKTREVEFASLEQAQQAVQLLNGKVGAGSCSLVPVAVLSSPLCSISGLRVDCELRSIW